MSTPDIYRDEPPTDPGWYWVILKDGSGKPSLGQLDKHGYFSGPYGIYMSAKPELYFKFGPRVPDAQKCQEIERGSVNDN